MTRPSPRNTLVRGLVVCLVLATAIVSCKARLTIRDSRLDELLRSSTDRKLLCSTVFTAYSTGYAGLSGDRAAEYVASQLAHNPEVDAVECHGDSDFAVRFRGDRWPETFILTSTRSRLWAFWPFHDMPA